MINENLSNEAQNPLLRVCAVMPSLLSGLNAIGQQPLIGHKSGKSAKTHWLTFMKGVGF